MQSAHFCRRQTCEQIRGAPTTASCFCKVRFGRRRTAANGFACSNCLFSPLKVCRRQTCEQIWGLPPSPHVSVKCASGTGRTAANGFACSNCLCSPLKFTGGKLERSSEVRPPPPVSVKCTSGTGRTAATRNSVFEQWYCKLTISMMFLEKMGRFFSIFPVISASKPMKMAKTEFPGKAFNKWNTDRCNVWSKRRRAKGAYSKNLVRFLEMPDEFWNKSFYYNNLSKNIANKSKAPLKTEVFRGSKHLWDSSVCPPERAMADRCYRP